MEPAALPKAISDHCVPVDSTSREDGPHWARHLLMLRCCRTDRAPRELVAVRASPGARAVVLHRAVPAGSRTSRRRNDGDDGERKREGQSHLAQHGHSPCAEARSGSCVLDRGTRHLFPRQSFECGSLGTSFRVLREMRRSTSMSVVAGSDTRVAMLHFFGMISATRSRRALLPCHRMALRSDY